MTVKHTIEGFFSPPFGQKLHVFSPVLCEHITSKLGGCVTFWHSLICSISDIWATSYVLGEYYNKGLYCHFLPFPQWGLSGRWGIYIPSGLKRNQCKICYKTLKENMIFVDSHRHRKNMNLSRYSKVYSILLQYTGRIKIQYPPNWLETNHVRYQFCHHLILPSPSHLPATQAPGWSCHGPLPHSADRTGHHGLPPCASTSSSQMGRRLPSLPFP